MVDVVSTTPPPFAIVLTDVVVALVTDELAAVLLVVNVVEVPTFGAVRTAKILPWFVRI